MIHVNSVDISGVLTENPVYKEPSNFPPCVEILLMNKRPVSGDYKNTKIKVVAWAAKAKAIMNSGMKAGDEVLFYDGYLRSDNVFIQQENGEGQWTHGRLRIENPKYFQILNPPSELSDFQEKMLANEE